MHFKLNDKALTYPLLGLVSALVLTLGLVFLSYRYQHQQVLLLDKNQQQIQQIKSKLVAHVQEQALRQQYLPAYQRMQAKGLIAAEQRNLWVTQLQQIYQQHKLLAIDYSIKPQQKMHTADLGPFSLVLSPMYLSMDLLHEGDLFKILDDLQQNAPPFVLRQCELTMPIDANINIAQLTPNLKAHCRLDWMSLNTSR
jgi:hypothetical protein